MHNQPTVISLFSGAGGLDYGFEAAGYRNGVCLELDDDCCDTLRASRPEWKVINRNIYDVPTKELLASAGVRRGDVDIVIGGPPCQPFSKAGYWASGDSARLADPRANTLGAFLRVVEESQPRALLLENVVGLQYAGKDEGLQQLIAGLRRINRRTKSRYEPFVKVVNAAQFGVPQLRERVFLVAGRDGASFTFPTPTHADSSQQELFDGSHERYVSAWDALADIPSTLEEDLVVRGKWAALLPTIPEGMNYLWHTRRGIVRAREAGMRPGRELFGWRRRYWTFLLKLAKARPSWTIQAQPGPAIGPFHWANRLLSTRELCRLQTFPDDVRVEGQRTSRQKQIGNAVPSLLAEVLAREIAVQLLATKRRRVRPTLLFERKQRIPITEEYVDVPTRFRHLEGRHTPHPGPGLGYGARERAAV